MRTYRLPIVAVMVTLLLFGIAAVVAAEQAVSVEARVKSILEIDGLQFKDLNSNGVLDPYEDWRLDTETRIDDLLSQMTIEEKVGLMFHINTSNQFTPPYPWTDADLETNRSYIEGQFVNTILDNNNGTPDYLADFHNRLQEIAESARLGIPIVFSSDRASNTWGGMIDFPHAAFGSANDLELASQLFDIYSQEMAAIGYHLTLHPSGVEVFRDAWGENHNYVAELTKAYVEAYTSSGVQTCLKHFPANGYAGARSAAELRENYLTSWAAGFAAGAKYIMFSARPGLSYANVQAHFDIETIEVLREMGFDGVALTDWFPVATRATGVTAEGIDLDQLSVEERYAYLLNRGVDQFGGFVMDGIGTQEEIQEGGIAANFPQALLQAVADGLVSETRIDESAGRILTVKFDLGLFDDPYVDPQAALELAASVDYIAEPWEISGTEELAAARNPHTQALDEALQAASAVLLTNDGTLPLKDGINVYFLGATDEVIARESAAIAEYANAVADPADADVAVVRITPGRRGFDDTAMAIVQAAVDTGLPTIVALDGLSSSLDLSGFVEEEGIAAILAMSFTVGSDHGSPMGGTFLGNTTPKVLWAMLFGRTEPSGELAYELGRPGQTGEDWGDVPFDLGATTAERMAIVDAILKGEEAPINLGDPLFMYSYGLGYNLNADLAYSILVLPSTVEPGESFVVSCLLTNNGYDGYTTAELYDNGTLIGSTFMAVVGGQSRVVEIEVVLNELGVHTIAVGSLAGQVEVAVPESE